MYSYSEDSLVCETFQIPAYFWGGYGLDVGWNATAAVFIRYDSDNKVYYVTDEYKRGECSPPDHAAAITFRSKFMSGAIDPASRGRSQLDGKSLMNEYRDLGLRLLPADNTVDAGLHRVQMLMSTSRLKILPQCTGSLAELSKYSRTETGQIRKQDDHLLDALRYCLFTRNVMRPLRPITKPGVNMSLPRINR